MLDDGEDDKEEQRIELSFNLETLKDKKKDQFLLLEVEIERRISQFDLKSGEVSVDGTSQDGRDLTKDNVSSSEPILSFIEKVEPVYDKEEVKSSQTSSSESEGESSSGSKKSGWREDKIKKKKRRWH